MSPMTVMPGGMQNGRYHDRLFSVDNLINNAIRETFGIAPAYVFGRMAS
jgi:hypothetical protein